ncbi:putative lipid-transfer protein DIR1 [Rhodamnia argentea]|uniref:Lipid-transfer protein DIR1 n=1 Tax=Rhodamnia argentea TaxID=178133 RepID=A0A8B8PP38_9MYRT|nr:putative lipid-transfer protein DIR1 [Rhodamnia argentea]
MAATNKKVVLLLGLMAVIACCTHAQQIVCNAPVSGLIACRPAVTLPNPPPPVAVCCDALRHADLKCLCQYKDSPLALQLHVSPKLALELPKKCKLPHPAPC